MSNEEIQKRCEEIIRKANFERELIDGIYYVFPNIPIKEKERIIREFLENLKLLNRIYGGK